MHDEGLNESLRKGTNREECHTIHHMLVTAKDCHQSPPSGCMLCVGESPYTLASSKAIKKVRAGNLILREPLTYTPATTWSTTQ